MGLSRAMLTRDVELNEALIAALAAAVSYP
jgi:hypothetical protein